MFFVIIFIYFSSLHFSTLTFHCQLNFMDYFIIPRNFESSDWWPIGWNGMDGKFWLFRVRLRVGSEWQWEFINNEWWELRRVDESWWHWMIDCDWLSEWVNEWVSECMHAWRNELGNYCAVQASSHSIWLIDWLIAFWIQLQPTFRLFVHLFVIYLFMVGHGLPHSALIWWQSLFGIHWR